MHIFAFTLVSLARVHQGRRLLWPSQNTRSHDPVDGSELANHSADLAFELQDSRPDERVTARDFRAPSAVALARFLEAVTPVSGFSPSGRFPEGIFTATSLDRRALDVKNSVSSIKTKLETREDKKKALKQEIKDSGLPPKKVVTMPDLPPSKIRVGDFCVHSTYGVCEFLGVFRGNENQDTDAPLIKCLKVRFKDGLLEMHARDAKNELKLFKRYEETQIFGAAVKLDQMKSTNSWDRRKRKAAEKVHEVATELMKLYAERITRTRQPCPPDSERYKNFEKAFKYKPTPDQLKTFAAVHDDMVLSERPMDRLVCGDVGYGKTEVAMRAIYRMAITGRQVGVLAPTTVLAAQHLKTLRARMPDLRVELLASIVKRRPKERERLHNAIKGGEVNVIIGTHALLSPKVEFHDMGLLIVDEEQRFGVRQKDKVKNVSATVDVLTLSATPIPRTMYMCMAGIRDMSKLMTAPKGRLPVETHVGVRDNRIMIGAIERELERKGQVFYVVPRIETLHPEVVLLKEMLPKGTRIAFAHGGLRDLEDRIVSFALGNYDILVATTIMENGIDIPNVNTIIVQEAHYFGLAQLHQLRGRVGRSNVQAYAYLMHSERLSDDAEKRLHVMSEATSANAGEVISQADLRNRGAGNVFGTSQKGHGGSNEAMGVEMYMEVLQRVMKYLKRKEELGIEDDPDMDAMLFQKSVDEMLLLGVDDSLAMKE